ncbi:MAG: response regulator [Candidatus Sulfotelmatobacter sp.]
MAPNSTLLCIHRDPAQLTLLQENGYELVTATNGSEGLRLLMSRPVDAIVLEYHLGLLDGAVVAAEIKRVRPQLPIVMLADHLELPDGALQSVDALVTKSDGAHFLWATIHFVLNVKPAKRRAGELEARTPTHLRRPRRSRDGGDRGRANPPHMPTSEQDAPFSPSVWRSIRDGSIEF